MRHQNQTYNPDCDPVQDDSQKELDNLGTGDWNKSYRVLKEGEIVLPTDEGFDNGKWKPAQGYVGKPAPDPRYPAHCVFRRSIESDVPQLTNVLQQILDALDERLNEAKHRYQPLHCPFCQKYQLAVRAFKAKENQ